MCALIGVLFVNGGITGNVVAENPVVGQDSTALSAVGVLIITISAALVIGYLRGSTRKSEKKQEEE